MERSKTLSEAYEMSITVTEAAAERIAAQLQQQPAGAALKISVSSSGCSGYMYDLDFVAEPGDDDSVFEQHGVRVVVDSRSLPFIDGTQVDWRREGLNEGFKFDNPNAKNLCGCGESFQL